MCPKYLPRPVFSARWTPQTSPWPLIAPFPARVSPDENLTVYRLACGVSLADGPVPHAPSTEYLQTLLDRCGAPLQPRRQPAPDPHREDLLILPLPHALSYRRPPLRPPRRRRPPHWRHVARHPRRGRCSRRTSSPARRINCSKIGLRVGALSVIALTKGNLELITAPRSLLRWFGFTIPRFFGRFAFVKGMVAHRISGLAEI
ncbi:hypothetical protein B0H17DRAFT_110831 [Mycena rosella]|uniref:Uncharacterized protein n=1 Tax=Mycena rosella TaxID=1033263 RepID=A0AAD7GD05_MYCRO|nr:hypothetical protein B0H17DRAFT_110831 [Mycena rosella]